jgi:hypothetical protein
MIGKRGGSKRQEGEKWNLSKSMMRDVVTAPTVNWNSPRKLHTAQIAENPR